MIDHSGFMFPFGDFTTALRNNGDISFGSAGDFFNPGLGFGLLLMESPGSLPLFFFE